MTLVAPDRSRLVSTATTALVGISHGTSSLEGREAVAALVDAVAAARPEITVAGGFVDVQQPDVPATLGSLDAGSSSVVVPLLLSAGYHVHVDLKQAIRSTPDRAVELASALGPDDRLVDTLVARLVEAGLRDTDRVVLACAGSSDPRAVDDCLEMRDRLAARLGRPVRAGFISAAEPRLGDAVDLELAAAARAAELGRVETSARVVVSTYLLAPGYFNDLAHATAADLTTEPLLAAGHPPPAGLVDLVLDRYAEALPEETI